MSMSFIPTLPHASVPESYYLSILAHENHVTVVFGLVICILFSYCVLSLDVLVMDGRMLVLATIVFVVI